MRSKWDACQFTPGVYRSQCRKEYALCYERHCLTDTRFPPRYPTYGNWIESLSPGLRDAQSEGEIRECPKFLLRNPLIPPSVAITKLLSWSPLNQRFWKPVSSLGGAHDRIESFTSPSQNTIHLNKSFSEREDRIQIQPLLQRDSETFQLPARWTICTR